MKPIDIAMIQARRRKIDAAVEAENALFQKYMTEYYEQVEEHNRRIAELAGEQDELEIAERVFAKLSGETAPGEGPRGKPAGTPPMPEMITEALGHYAALGRPHQRPAEILAYIRGKWWPEAHATDVGPIAWRMWNRDQLVKFTDGTYGLLEEEEVEEPQGEVEPELDLPEEDTAEEDEAA
jgi:hypothetical protein